MDSQSYNTADDEIAGPSVVYHEEGLKSWLQNAFLLIYIRLEKNPTGFFYRSQVTTTVTVVIVYVYVNRLNRVS